jgi:Fe-Mn family superoxide dismutase
MMNRRLVVKALGMSVGFAAASNRYKISSFAQSTASGPAQAPSGAFTLPPLPYAYDALEPYIDATTMHLHHDKHHQAYVDNLNATVASHPELAERSLEQLITHLDTLPETARTPVRNHGGGHFNHSLMWPTLVKGGSAPAGELAKAIYARFGSLSALQDQLKSAAMGVFGSGWAWLVMLPDGALAIEATANQDTPLSAQHRPLLAIDVWEHAYYLKYQNRRAEYADALFHVVNWDFISERFAHKHEVL